MNGNQDPLKDWLVSTYRDVFGDPNNGNQVGEDGKLTRIGRFTPFSPFVAVVAGVALYAPRIMSAVGNETVVDVLGKVHSYRVLLVAAAAVLIVCDVLRYRTHKMTQMLESVVRQGSGHLPKKITVSLVLGSRVIRRVRMTKWMRTIEPVVRKGVGHLWKKATVNPPFGARMSRRATIKLHRGTVIRPKQFEGHCQVVWCAAVFGHSDLSHRAVGQAARVCSVT